MKLKGLGNEVCRFDARKIYGPRSFDNQNMFTLRLKGNMQNWLSQVKFNDLDRYTFKSMAILQSIIQFANVLYVKDKGGSVAMDRNKGLKMGERSKTQDESYRMDG